MVAIPNQPATSVPISSAIYLIQFTEKKPGVYCIILFFALCTSYARPLNFNHGNLQHNQANERHGAVLSVVIPIYLFTESHHHDTVFQVPVVTAVFSSRDS